VILREVILESVFRFNPRMNLIMERMRWCGTG
jgi:hypothetical protein